MTNKATPKMIAEWKKIYVEQRNSLPPNRKSGKQLDEYLKVHFEAVPINTEKANKIVTENIMNNEPFKEKLQQETAPYPATYYVGSEKLFVGIDLVTGYFTVEGSEKIYDELFAYRGLNERDLENYYLAAEYVRCKVRQS